MDDHETRLQKMEAILADTVNGLGIVGDLIAAQMTITNVIVELVRERHGLDNAEIRERALALAQAAGLDREGVVAQIAAMLPDTDPLGHSPRVRLN